ncbi:MAG: hypothetical protein ABI778_03070 [Ignavibacteriota bacterium]
MPKIIPSSVAREVSSSFLQFKYNTKSDESSLFQTDSIETPKEEPH